MALFGVGTAARATTDPAALALAVSELDADHDRASAALYVLQAGGERAAMQIRTAWPTISVLGQKRAVSALARLAARHDAAIDTLVAAARADDADLRDRAFAALRQIGSRGRLALATLVSDSAVGDRAASFLARVDPDFAMTPLLDAISEPGGADRPALRAALGHAVERSRGDASKTLLRWLAKEPAVSAVASASLGLVGVEGRREVMTALIAYAAPRSNEFASTWRLLQSAASAGPNDEIDRWVRTLVDGPEEWMLRQAAVEVSAARGHRDDARASLKDPYPRVRASAATALSGDDSSMLERASRARRDPWPMVRAAAVRSLRSEEEALAVVVASVDDSMSQVRAAAIEVLTASPSDQGWERVHRRLRNPDEWPLVTAAAIDYVVAHCRTDAAEALFHVVMRAAPGNALTEDLNNAALAIEALRALGSPEAVATVEQLRSTPAVPPTLKTALERPLGEDGRCTPKSP